MYTYTLFLPHLWTPSSAINADPAPGAEVVIFFVNERARDATHQEAELSKTQINKIDDNWNEF